MRRACVALLVVFAGACQERMWPDAPHARRTSTKQGVTFSVSVPEDFGSYEDSRGIIWRDVDADHAIYVKVYLTDLPRSLSEAEREPALDAAERVTVKQRTRDGYRIVVRAAKTGRERTWLWKRRGGRTVYCHTLWILRDPKPAVVARYNDWMRARCDSLRIEGDTPPPPTR